MSKQTELLKEIDHTLNYLKLEYHSEVGLEFINLERGIKYLKNLADKTKKLLSLNKKQNESLVIKQFDKDKYPLYELVKDTNYLELKDIELYKPISLSVTFLDFITLLDKHQDTGLHLNEMHLKPFNVWLINLINDSEELAKLTKKDVIKFNQSKDIIKDFSLCFKGKVGVDTGLYSDLLKRNKDWDEIVELMSVLTNEATSKNLNTLNESLDNSVNLVNDLINEIQNNTQITISKPVLEELSTSIYNLAQLSNISSLYLTKMLSTTNSLEDNYNRLSEIIK